MTTYAEVTEEESLNSLATATVLGHLSMDERILRILLDSVRL